MQGERRDRVSDLIQKEVARLLQREVHDSRVGFVTVTGVDMSSDLRNARIFVSVLGDEENRKETQAALDSARGFIRSRIGRNLHLRFTPEISFQIDTTIEKGARIEDLLRSVLPSPDNEEDE